MFSKIAKKTENRLFKLQTSKKKKINKNKIKNIAYLSLPMLHAMHIHK